MSRELVLIDFSTIVHAYWHQAAQHDDPNWTSREVIQRVRNIAQGVPHLAICCDAPAPTFRHDYVEVYNAAHPDAPMKLYKAGRPDKDARFQHEADVALGILAKDGFAIWRAEGFEADDLIASATARVLAGSPDDTVRIVTIDKDLTQLIDDAGRVKYQRASDMALVDAEGVVAKFGVRPAQMGDYLALVGDTSDNIQGCPGIGPTKAKALLAAYGSIQGFYDAYDRDPLKTGQAAGTLRALAEYRSVWPTIAALVTLNRDAPIPDFDRVWGVRVAQPLVQGDAWDLEPEANEADEAEPAAAVAEGPQEPPDARRAAVLPFEAKTPDPSPVGAVAPTPPAEPPSPGVVDTVADAPAPIVPPPVKPPAPTAIARREPQAPEVLPPVTYERQLDPQSLVDARRLAVDMHNSRMFTGYGGPEGVLATVMVGRELGIPAMSALRNIHVIEGKHSLSSALMVALVLRSGLAEFFEAVEFSDTAATFETKRVGARNPVKLTYTIEMAKTAGLAKPNSNWTKNPMAMCIARAQAMLARLVYPDLLAGLYTPEEMTEIRDAKKEAR